MIVGIVGSEAAKFTPETETRARLLIRSLLTYTDVVCSGRCHLGGIDSMAEQEAAAMGLATLLFPPDSRSWEDGYKPRNIKIAEASDIVYCVTVRELPATYTGMRFTRCYHCNTTEHVKSGGCWTTKYARKLGKPGVTLVV